MDDWPKTGGYRSDAVERLKGLKREKMDDADIPMAPVDGDKGWITHESEVGQNNYVTCDVPGRRRLAGEKPGRWTLHVGQFEGRFYGWELEFDRLSAALHAAANFRKIRGAIAWMQHEWGWSQARLQTSWAMDEEE